MKVVTKSYLDDLTYQIIGACIEVHKFLGAGLLESVYHKFLKRELELRGIPFETEKRILTKYKGIIVDTELRCDLLVDGLIILELKSVIEMHPFYESQLLSYMKLAGCPKGILVNFNCNNIFKDGQKTYVNEIFRSLPE